MEYKKYQLEDFLKDDFFVSWVKRPGPESVHFWEKWMAENPDKLPLLQQAREIIQRIKYKNTYQPSESEYNSILENVLRNQQPYYKNSRSSVWNSPLFGRVAATFISLVTFAGIFYFLTRGELEKPNEPVAKEKPSAITRYNPYGQRIAFKLQDGTEVKLNSDTRITFPVVFDSLTREITLEGEAFFTVARDENRPFIIRSGDLTTTVLGTSFNIKAYKSDQQIEVAVLSGSVKLSKNDSAALEEEILLPSEMGRYSPSRNRIQKENFDPMLITAWKDGILYFNRSNFNYVFSALSHWYGVYFVMEDGKKVPGNFTGSFFDKSLEEVLEGISFASNFTYTIKGDTVFVNNK
ncbi:MAG: FecR domain-containing protein [Cyclobacteriaceae bacterium]|nr:FecR domain-containing protein [Cyclobacteriaceae bacterium]